MGSDGSEVEASIVTLQAQIDQYALLYWELPMVVNGFRS